MISYSGLKHSRKIAHRLFRFISISLLCAGVGRPQEFVISTYAGGPLATAPVTGANVSLGAVGAMVTDPSGNLYFTSLNSVFRLAPNGVLRRVAGNEERAWYSPGGTPVPSGDGGLATNARLWFLGYDDEPFIGGGLALDPAGNVYVADSANHRIRRVSPDGVISTVAGDGTYGYSGDGDSALRAHLGYPSSLALDAFNNLYFVDLQFPGLDFGPPAAIRLRKISADGSIDTVALPGNPTLRRAAALAFDRRGNLYISDMGNNRVLRLSTSGELRELAGNGGQGYSGDGGPAIGAQLSQPYGVAADLHGNLYIADSGNGRIRKVAPDGTISTFAGGASQDPGANDSALRARLSYLYSVTADQNGNVYVDDSLTGRIRVVSPDGLIHTVAGNGRFQFSGDGGPALVAQFSFWGGMAVDREQNLYIAANLRVRKISADGVVTTFVGGGAGNVDSGDGDAATAHTLNAPTAVAIDSRGDVYIADTGRVRKVTRDGIMTTIAGNGKCCTRPTEGARATDGWVMTQTLTFDVDDNLYLSGLRKVSPDGTISTVTGAPLGNVALAADHEGAIYGVEWNQNVVWKMSKDGIVVVVAGNGRAGYSGDGGPATEAQLWAPTALAVDGAGNLYIADSYNGRIRRVSKDGIISTVAGNGTCGYSGDGGPALGAELGLVTGLTVDGPGSIYLADVAHGVIRVLRPMTGGR